MTTPMPEPVAWRTRYRSEPGMIGHYPWSHTGNAPFFRDADPHYETESLITTDQAEAYAAARVREALEEAGMAVESCRTTGTIRDGSIDSCIAAIRALIPSTPA